MLYVPYTRLCILCVVSLYTSRAINSTFKDLVCCNGIQFGGHFCDCSVLVLSNHSVEFLLIVLVYKSCVSTDCFCHGSLSLPFNVSGLIIKGSIAATQLYAYGFNPVLCYCLCKFSHVILVFLWVSFGFLWFPSIVQKHASRQIGLRNCLMNGWMNEWIYYLSQT